MGATALKYVVASLEASASEAFKSFNALKLTMDNVIEVIEVGVSESSTSGREAPPEDVFCRVIDARSNVMGSIVSENVREIVSSVRSRENEANSGLVVSLV
jgi:hypothetical protein